MKLLRALLLSAALFTLNTASAAENEVPVAGLNVPFGISGQYTPDTWGLDVHMGLGIKLWALGFGGEIHYVHNWGALPVFPALTTKQVMYLGRVDLYPVGGLKLSGLAGGSYFTADDAGSSPLFQHMIGARLGFEAHPSKYFSVEPAFTVLQPLNNPSFRSYQLTFTFSLWNEAVLGSIIRGLIAGSFRSR